MNNRMDLDDLACLASAPALAAPPAPAPLPSPAPTPARPPTSTPLCALLPAPASKTADSPLWISIPEPGALEDHDRHLTNPHHESNFESLQAKYKLICEVDAIFQKHMDGVREQQKHWKSALDTFMLEAEHKGKATTARGSIIKTSGGCDTSLACAPKKSVDLDLAACEYLYASERGGQSACLDDLQVAKRDSTGICFGSENGGQSSSLDDVPITRRDSTNIMSSLNSISIRTSDSKRGSVLSKASSHHIQRKKSCEDFSKLKRRMSYNDAVDKRFTFRKGLQKVICSTPFDGCVFGFIFANVLFVGIEVDYIASHPGIPVPDLFTYSNYCFAAVFAVELTLRLLAYGCAFLQITDNKDWAWNWFDVVVVASSLVEIAADVVKTSSSNMDMVHLRVIRIIRVTRLLRTLRMVRMVRFIRALRTLLYSILATLRAAIWSLLLLLIIFYGFGVGLTQAVMDYCDTLPVDEDNPFTTIQSRAANCQDENLIEFWGTLPRSMFTLFKSVAGGISWHVVVQPLSEAGFLWVSFFVVFITFTLFAVLNVVTGLFCQSAIESAKQDKDIATMQNLASKAYHTKALEQLWEEMDVENSGNLTIHEFQQCLENNRILAFFESLDICCNDAWALYHLLDSEGEGKVDKDDFVDGCLHLRGAANAVSLAKMAYDNKIVFEMLEEFMEFMEDSMSSLKVGTDGGQATGPWETQSASSTNSSGAIKPANGFEREVSHKSDLERNNSAKSVFSRQMSSASEAFGRKNSANRGLERQGSSGFARQISSKRTPLSFNRQASPNRRMASKEREARLAEESIMGA